MEITSGVRPVFPVAPIVRTLRRKRTDQVHKARQHCGARLRLQLRPIVEQMGCLFLI